jgi:hypothetical protein
MKLLLKVLLFRRARDEGFTLPMVIAIGLVMILLSAVNIVRSNEENLNAITQNSRTDALAIAELGIARYRELLDRNRVLTIYNLGDWTARTEVCDTITDTGGGWADSASAAWRNITLDETTVGADINSDGDTTDTSLNIGSYKIVGYTYNGRKVTATNNPDFDQTRDVSNENPAGTPATGTLRVKGRATDGSEAQIQAEIPIRINASDMTNLAPALWIGDGTLDASSMGNLTIPNTTNIVLSQAGTGCNDPANIGTNSVIADSRSVPSISNIVTLIGAATTGVTKNSISTTTNLSGSPLLGQTTDKQHGDGRYYYEVNNTNPFIIDPNTDIQTDGTAEATLYVDNNMTINNGVKINSDSISSAYFEIYVNGNRTITINTGATPIEITALIHAPNSTLNITGTGNVTINGSVWVREWNNSTSGTVTITPDNTYDSLTASNDLSYKFYTTTQQRTPKPITSNPSDWKTQEVNY